MYFSLASNKARLHLQEFMTVFSSSLGIPGKTMGTLFTPIPVTVTAYEPERVGGRFITSLKRLLFHFLIQ